MSEVRSRSPSGVRNHHNRTAAGTHTNSNDSRALRCRVFIGNLSTDKTSKAEVEELFSKYGAIASSSLHNNFGFIQFDDEEGADRAVEEMHGKTLFGKRVDVNLAGLRRKPQSKDQFDGAPLKQQVVPAAKVRDRSPVRGDRDAVYGRPASSPYYPSTTPLSYPHVGHRTDGNGLPTEDSQTQDYRYDHRRPYNDRPRPARPTIDCEIVSLSKDQTRYAEEVESRLRSIGMVCNIGYPPAELPLLELMERISRTGSLYAVVVTEQNAEHNSCTLNILHGTRQEHRNMPLNDALSFMAKNFDSYLRSIRPAGYASQTSTGYWQPNSTPPPVRQGPPPPVQQDPPANYEAKEKQMSSEEIEAMIAKLKREKEEREARERELVERDQKGYSDLNKQSQEPADVPLSTNYSSYDKYPPAQTSHDTTIPTSEYYQQYYAQQQPLYR